MNVNPEAENQIAAAESQNNEVRVQFADEQNAANDAAAPELAPLDDVEVSEDNRNKRFLNFGGGASSGGSGGGSGNFLFDIIRVGWIYFLIIANRNYKEGRADC